MLNEAVGRREPTALWTVIATTMGPSAAADNGAPARRRRLADEPAPLGDGAFAAMGGLWSTVTDVARWVSFLLDAFPARDRPDDGALRHASRRNITPTTWAQHPARRTTRRAGSADGHAAGSCTHPRHRPN